MSRFLAVLAAGLLCSGAAAAQSRVPAPAPAPANSPAGKIAFPATVGDARLERTTTQPGQGQTYFYATPKRLLIVAQVFTGNGHVPSGSDNPAVVSQFAFELDEVEQQAKQSGFGQFERPAVASTCRYGSVSFRCSTYSAAIQGNARLYSKLLLTGFRDSFVKIHVEWVPIRQQTAADAEAALQAFVPAVMR
ncbi:hypothetical protein BH11PSE3_BH11PSE3_47660 [soil metagenome]